MHERLEPQNLAQERGDAFESLPRPFDLNNEDAIQEAVLEGMDEQDRGTLDPVVLRHEVAGVQQRARQRERSFLDRFRGNFRSKLSSLLLVGYLGSSYAGHPVSPQESETHDTEKKQFLIDSVGAGKFLLLDSDDKSHTVQQGESADVLVADVSDERYSSTVEQIGDREREMLARMVYETFPKTWGDRATVSKIVFSDESMPMPASYKGDQLEAAGEARDGLNESPVEIAINIKLDGAISSSLPGILVHEFAHASDWYRTSALSLEDRYELMHRIVQRVQDENRIHFSYPEKYQSKDTKSETDQRSVEYWAVLMEKALQTPGSNEEHWEGLLSGTLQNIDPKADVRIDIENVKWYLKKIDPEFKPWEATQKRKELFEALKYEQTNDVFQEMVRDFPAELRETLQDLFHRSIDEWRVSYHASYYCTQIADNECSDADADFARKENKRHNQVSVDACVYSEEGAKKQNDFSTTKYHFEQFFYFYGMLNAETYTLSLTLSPDDQRKFDQAKEHLITARDGYAKLSESQKRSIRTALVDIDHNFFTSSDPDFRSPNQFYDIVDNM